MKSKIRIINVGKEEIKMDNTDLVNTIKNKIKLKVINLRSTSEDFHMRILKKLIKEKLNQLGRKKEKKVA